MATFIRLAGRHINLDQVRRIECFPVKGQGKHGIRINWAGIEEGSLFEISLQELSELHAIMYPTPASEQV